MKVVSASEDGLLPTSAFADDIVVNVEEEEANIAADRLDTATTRNKMEIGPEKNE